MPNEPVTIPHVLDDPPPFHQKLLGYGERPYWSADGSRIAFIEKNYPDGEHICLESSCDNGADYPPQNLWKLKLDGSQQRVRMTSMPGDRTWKATNSNGSPDGRWLAFMVALQSDESGYGRGLGLLDLEAWGRSPQAQEWETPTSRARARLDRSASAG